MSYHYDPIQGIRHLRNVDPALARAMDNVGAFALQVTPLNPFQALLRAIVYQQLSGKAAAAIYRRICQLSLSEGPPEPKEIIEASEETLRAAGMSRAKVAATKDLAEKTLSGQLPAWAALHRMSDEAIIEHLVTVRGVGRWTVEMLLIFNLGRADVLPATDLGIRKGFGKIYRGDAPEHSGQPAAPFGRSTLPGAVSGAARKARADAHLPSAATILQHGERWRPFRSLASWYLWRTDAPEPPP